MVIGVKNLLTTYDLQSAAKKYAFPFVGGLQIPRFLIGRTFFYGGLQIRRDGGAEVLNSRKNPTIFLLNKNKNLIFAADLEENRISRNKQVINDKETIL